MVNAQEWLDEKYPLNQREQIEEVSNNYGGELIGELVIENFPNLKRICLANNKKITKLSIRNCSQVKEIVVPNNQITELTINELTNLELLNCAKNQLTELDLNSNIKTKKLLLFGNPRLRSENIKGLEKLTQLSSFECNENLQLITIIKEIYEEKFRAIRAERDEALRNLQTERTAHEQTSARFVSANDTITDAQNELGVTNLNNLPLMPPGETLNTLLQRPTRAELEQAQNELNIEKDHAQDMDNWYRKLINENLTNELLQSQRENQQKSRLIDELESELENKIEILKQIAEAEIKDNLKLFVKVQDKKKELKQLKTGIKDKLESELQKTFLNNLLTAQEQLIYLEDASQQSRLPSEKQLQRAKNNLINKLSEEEIDSLCQLQTEITKLEIELEQIKEDKLEAKIEERQIPRFRN
ncbi:MAG: hypothetical protein MRECE_16c025 [Mycoplasmataceae bacterium CE_OT135]|nr:MAG: hypothetical protein MRECE_16c025 [Mycoplasmataceae bacterium CE_OT135]